MPLSNNEQRILDEIEKELSSVNADFSTKPDDVSGYKDVLISSKWAILGIVFGFILMVATVFINFWLATVGLFVAVACSVYIENIISSKISNTSSNDFNS